MSSPEKRAIVQNLKELKDSPLEGITACPDRADIFHWKAVILGPEGTIWEGGTFRLTIEIPDGYPNYPPKIKFTTPVFHPNIYQDGRICVDILDAGKWTSKNSIASALLSIQSLLNDPNPKSPANREASDLFVSNRPEYEKRVRKCVEDSMSVPE